MYYFKLRIQKHFRFKIHLLKLLKKKLRIKIYLFQILILKNKFHQLHKKQVIKFLLNLSCLSNIIVVLINIIYLSTNNYNKYEGGLLIT